MPNLLIQLTTAYKMGTAGIRDLKRAIDRYQELRATKVPPNVPLRDPEVIDGVFEELAVQEKLEPRWQDLVRTVAPEAGDQQAVFGFLRLVIEQAIFDTQQSLAGGARRVSIPYEQALPPQFEQSLLEIARSQRPHAPLIAR